MKKFILFMMPVVLFALVSCNEKEENPVLEVNETTLLFTKDGGEKEVNITSNQKWEIVIEDTEWLTTQALEGEGSKTVKFIATPYDDAKDRANSITIKSATITRKIAVTQSAAAARLDVDKTTLSYNYAGGTEVLSVTSNTDWEVVIAEEDNWLAADVSGGAGDAEVILTIPTYYGKENRNATVTLKCEGAEKKVVVSQTFPKTVGVWMLSEGSPYSPTADLAYYDVVNDELKTKVYSTQNGGPIGMIANYMGLYGSKLYIAVSGDSGAQNSSVKVVDSKTGALIKSIPMKSTHGEGDVARQLAFHDGKVYVTSYWGGGKGEPGDDYAYYGGVTRIDTVSLAIEAVTRVGDKPEGIMRYNDKLFVFNNETGEGKTMSVVDIAGFTEEKTVAVPPNPVYFETASNGDVYFSTLEVFLGPDKGTLSAIHKLNPETYEVTTFEGARASRFAVTDQYIFTGEFSWTAFADTINKIDRQTGEVTDVEIDNAMFMVYGFDANPVTGEVYMGGQGDDVIVLDKDGNQLKSMNIGVPYVNQFIFMYE